MLPNAPLCPGTLNLKLRLEGEEETVLWTQRGTQGSVWHRGRATLPATGQQQYRVRAESSLCHWVPVRLFDASLSVAGGF